MSQALCSQHESGPGQPTWVRLCNQHADAAHAGTCSAGPGHMQHWHWAANMSQALSSRHKSGAGQPTRVRRWAANKSQAQLIKAVNTGTSSTLRHQPLAHAARCAISHWHMQHAAPSATGTCSTLRHQPNTAWETLCGYELLMKLLLMNYNNNTMILIS